MITTPGLNDLVILAVAVIQAGRCHAISESETKCGKSFFNRSLNCVAPSSYPTLLGDTPADLVFYLGGDVALTAQCVVGMEWTFLADGAGLKRVLRTRDPDIYVATHSVDPTNGKLRSYLEWRHIGETGNLTCCRVKNGTHNCLCELRVQIKTTLVSTPASTNTESRKNVTVLLFAVLVGIILLTLVIALGLYITTTKVVLKSTECYSKSGIRPLLSDSPFYE